MDDDSPYWWELESPNTERELLVLLDTEGVSRTRNPTDMVGRNFIQLSSTPWALSWKKKVFGDRNFDVALRAVLRQQ